MAYRYEWYVRFGQVDLARTIYYPRLFDIVHHGVEDFLRELGYSFRELIFDRGVGLPIVAAEAEYLAPIEYGRMINISLIPEVGKSSIRFESTGEIDGTNVFEAVETHAAVDMNTFKSIPLPDDIRDALKSYDDG